VREAIDTFSNVGTSNVFFQLVLGRITPKAIAASLGTKPPAVVEHLHKLRGTGVVELGEKKGKYQHYEIDWKRFVHEFFEHIYTPGVQRVHLRSGDGAVEREMGSMKEIMGELKRSELFLGMLRRYFENLARDMEGELYPKRTVWGAIYCFEEALWYVPQILDKVTNPETRKLLALLERWNRYMQRFSDHGPLAALESSVKAVEGSKDDMS